MKIWMFIGIILALIGVLFYSFSIKQIETPQYQLLKKFGSVEIREYPTLILAQTTFSKSNYDQSSNSGFRTVANYIFGGNQSQQKIAMTAPVIMDMGDSSSMSFVMPIKYSLEELPLPNSSQVQLKKQEPRILAVLGFGGYANDEKIKKYGDLLIALVKENGWEIEGSLLFMGYNAPWDVIGRRNEVALALKNFPRNPL